MTDPYAALRQALEALQLIYGKVLLREYEEHECTAAITAARAALAAKVEPVAEAGPEDMKVYDAIAAEYATPPQREPLTDADLLKLWGPRSDGPENREIISYGRAVERKVRGE